MGERALLTMVSVFHHTSYLLISQGPQNHEVNFLHHPNINPKQYPKTKPQRFTSSDVQNQTHHRHHRIIIIIQRMNFFVLNPLSLSLSLSISTNTNLLRSYTALHYTTLHYTGVHATHAHTLTTILSEAGRKDDRPPKRKRRRWVAP